MNRTKPALVRCMHGEAAVGGSARVRFADNANADLDDLARQTDPRGNVLVLVAGTDSNYRAESYQPDGTPIQFCGHGALAAAHVVFAEQEPDASELRFTNRRHSWTAKRTTDPQADITLIYESPGVQICEVPEFVADVMGADAIGAAEAGGANDYLLLEFPTADHVRTLEPDFAALTAATGRAVIATAADDDGVVFRYFAPQYGQPEDAATGSAAVQLVAYWAPKLLQQRFTARQLSTGGAVMQLACHTGVVELSARVAYGE